MLPPDGLVLELASGTGQHAVHFTRALPGIRWQPSDIDQANLASIDAWRADADADRVEAPVRLDACVHPWPIDRADAVLCINMIHIAPWEACLGLLEGAARILPEDGPLVLYGPYAMDGSHTAPSNAAFDESLRARDPRWGVRDLADVRAEAEARGFELVETVAMPANNLTVVFRKRGGGA